jgi:transposase
MPAPYSLDLRKRAINLLEKNTPIEKISKILEISTSTLKLWIKRKERDNTIEAKIGYQKGHSHKVINKEAFLNEINKNPSITLEELGKIFQCSRSSTHRFTKKIGLSYKKNFWI